MELKKTIFLFVSLIVVSEISCQQVSKENKNSNLYANRSLYDSFLSPDQISYFLKNYSQIIDIDFVDHETGYTTLIQAIRYGFFDVVRILLQNGANINACDINGKTPLMHAILGKNFDWIAKILSEHKDIDVNIKDFEGLNALNHARIGLEKSQGYDKLCFANTITFLEGARHKQVNSTKPSLAQIKNEDFDEDLGGYFPGCIIL